jgi:hypothetical protein
VEGVVRAREGPAVFQLSSADPCLRGDAACQAFVLFLILASGVSWAQGGRTEDLVIMPSAGDISDVRYVHDSIIP